MRRLPFGNNWTSMRIGIRFAIWGAHFGSIPTSLTFTTNIGLSLGVCNGPQGFLHDRPAEYIGYKIPGASATWANSAFNVNPPYYTQSSAAARAVQRTAVGGYLADENDTGNTTLISSAPHLVRNIMMLTITKGSATWSFQQHSCTTSVQVQADCNRSVLLYNMGLTTPSVTYVTNAAATTMAYTLTTGVFDHVAVGWGKFIPQMVINDIAVARFS